MMQLKPYTLIILVGLGFVVSSTEVVASEEAAAPEAAATNEILEDAQDSIRLRVRKRLEEPPRLGASTVKSEDTSAPSTDAGLSELWQKLQKEKQELDLKAKDLERRELKLAEREAILKTQLTRYEQSLGELRTEVNGLRGLRDTKVDEFRKIYSKMEAKKAARILDDMDTDLAGQILSSLRENQSAEILSQMDPERARRITARFLTGRSFGQYKPH